MKTFSEFYRAIRRELAVFEEIDAFIERNEEAVVKIALASYKSKVAEKEALKAPADPNAFATPADLDLDEGTAAYRNQSHSPRKRAEHDIQLYVETMNKFHADMAAMHPGDISGELQQAKTEYINALRAYWTATSNSSSWAITGRSGRNVRREAKKNATRDRRSADLIAVLPKWRARLKKSAKSQAIEEGGGALAVAERELASREAHSVLMPKANRTIRSKTKTDDVKVAELVALGYTAADAAVAVRERLVWRPYEMANARGRIKASKAKVQRLRTLEANKDVDDIEIAFTGSEEFPYAGTVTYDYAEDRIFLDFDVRIPKDVYQKIARGTGFNWSRARSMFSHRLGETGRRTAARITGATMPPIAPPRTNPSPTAQAALPW